MPEKITLALVITNPDHLWSGLQSLLRTVPQIEIIAESQDPSVLLKMNTEIHPELILIDANTFDETDWAAITKIKVEFPQTKIVVLVEHDLQRISAQDAGADIVLPKGYPAAKLVKLIEDGLIDNAQDEIN